MSENNKLVAILWKTANKLRNNMDAAEYKHVVLGLIFLKYISDSFEELYQKLKSESSSTGSDPEDKQLHQAANYKYTFVVKEDSPESKQMGLGFDSLIVLDRIFQLKKFRLAGVIGTCPQFIIDKIEEILQLMRKNGDPL